MVDLNLTRRVKVASNLHLSCKQLVFLCISDALTQGLQLVETQGLQLVPCVYNTSCKHPVPGTRMHGIRNLLPCPQSKLLAA